VKTVLLFDIDGTLVLTGGSGRRAMISAFAKVHGSSDVFEGLSFGGLTDRALARHGLRALGRSTAETEAEIDHILETYLELLVAELERADGYRILPGVVRLLDLLVGRPDVAIGLGTGNVRRGAYAKLARGSLASRFAFGGFGCDAEDRTELIRAGAERGAAALAATRAECRVVVIGDTPKDVAAAKGIGAVCVGVGTGGFSASALVACGAEHAFDTLDDRGVADVLMD
jgi:phosphoglycolate phosphatase-like HAD superfamily hydrolase